MQKQSFPKPSSVHTDAETVIEPTPQTVISIAMYQSPFNVYFKSTVIEQRFNSKVY